MGAVVPLKSDEKTEFSGEGVKSGRDLTEGHEVRASFTVTNETTNVAKRITIPSASGQPAPAVESGSPRPEQMPPGQHPQIPPERGPGIPPDRLPTPRDPSNPPGRSRVDAGAAEVLNHGEVGELLLEEFAPGRAAHRE